MQKKNDIIHNLFMIKKKFLTKGIYFDIIKTVHDKPTPNIIQ